MCGDLAKGDRSILCECIAPSPAPPMISHSHTHTCRITRAHREGRTHSLKRIHTCICTPKSPRGEMHITTAHQLLPNANKQSKQQVVWRRTCAQTLLIFIPLLFFAVLLFGKMLPRRAQLYTPCSDLPPESECDLRIPRIIHQTYKSNDLPEHWRMTPEIWKMYHPDWEYMFWTDEDNRKLVATFYPEYLELYDGYPHPIQRADAARVFILHKYGGVYADLDVMPVRNIEELLNGVHVAVGETPNIGVTNAFMATTAESDFFTTVMKSLPEYAKFNLLHLSRHWAILSSTGPTFLWMVLSSYTGGDRVTVIPASVWGKCSICESRCALVESPYFKHLVGNSWHKWDSTLFTYGLFCHPVLTLYALLLATFLVLGAPWSPYALVREHLRLLAIFFLAFFLTAALVAL